MSNFLEINYKFKKIVNILHIEYFATLLTLFLQFYLLLQRLCNAFYMLL